MKCVMFVEDDYGVKFHQAILDQLGKSIKVLKLQEKCNNKIYRDILRYFDSGFDKAIIVVDREKEKIDSVKNWILKHIKFNIRKKVSVVVIDPFHEKWLCAILSDDVNKCRNDPISLIQSYMQKPYDHSYLSRFSSKINKDSIKRLYEFDDFKEYVKAIEEC